MSFLKSLREPIVLLSCRWQQDINYLHGRIKDFQISLRLTYNTNWIQEFRAADIKATAEVLRNDYGPGAEMDDLKKKTEANLIARLNAMTKAQKCNRKGCYTGRGYTGINVSLGQFTLCKCTEDTINYYKLHD